MIGEFLFLLYLMLFIFYGGLIYDCMEVGCPSKRTICQITTISHQKYKPNIGDKPTDSDINIYINMVNNTNKFFLGKANKFTQHLVNKELIECYNYGDYSLPKLSCHCLPDFKNIIQYIVF